MPDLLDRLKAALADRYAVERELGHGGMATVYLATDAKHNRAVAVKVLHLELAQSLGNARFLQEIQIAAKLNHPNVLPLHDSGEAGEFLYYAMPYVQGESLRDRLTREKQLPIADALNITREVADAIAHAHSHGIVHRDLKPENILLSEGHAVVADFGIALAVTAAGDQRLTETGLTIGTPAYMSPEQASGDGNLDGRSDIYSLGCVLYEMLIGNPPFTGATPQVILARKSLEAVPGLRAVRETVPASVEHAVMQALAKVPADRFATAGQFVEALERLGPVVPVAATTKPRRWRLWTAVALVVSLAVGSYLGVSRFTAAHTPPRVLVLPFENLGPAAEDYFADGIADQVASRLAGISGIRVLGRTTALRYGREDKTIAEIGAELDVDYVLVGTVSWDLSNQGANRVLVTPQLIRVSDESNLWAEPYEVPMTDFFSLQATVSQNIVQALGVTLLEPERRALLASLTDSEEAYEAYLRGNQYPPYWTELASDRRLAIESFRRAIDLDPEFAEAHARLAAHYAWSSELMPAEAERLLPLAERHADLALSLDPDLAWGHLAKAAYLSVRHADPQLVFPHLERAERAAPGASEVLELLALFYMATGEWERALHYNLRALELDPLRPDNAYGVGIAYFALRRHQEGEPYLARAIELAPDRWSHHVFAAWLYLSWQGDVARTRSVLQSAVQRLGQEAVIAGIMQSGWWVGRLMASDEWYRAAVERTSLGSPDLDSVSYYLHKAALYDGLGDRERSRSYADSAVRVLDGATRERVPSLVIERHRELAIAHAMAGDTSRAVSEARQGLSLARSPLEGQVLARIDLALTYALVGNYESAVEEFDRVLAEPNFVTHLWLGADPALAPLRATSQYKELLRKHDN
jgi:serine/threonine-protein kinase